MQVAVDAAELLAGSTIPAAHQRSAICPSRQRLTLLACSPQTEIIDSMQFVERTVRAGVGGTPNRNTGSVSSRPSRTLAAAPGAVEFFGQGQQRRLGLQRRRRMVGISHPAADS